jgi:hypothetical protein
MTTFVDLLRPDVADTPLAKGSLVHISRYHHVGSVCRPLFDTDQPRHFKIDGDALVVSETYLNGSTRIRTERVFVREPVRGLRNLGIAGGK